MTEQEEVHYTAAGGVVVHGDRVLVMRRPSRGETRLPKGHVERGESMETAALREVLEETGYGDLRVAADLGEQVVAFTFDGKRYRRRERYFLMVSAADRPRQIGAPEAEFEPEWLLFSDALAQLTYEGEREWLRKARAFAWDRSNAGEPLVSAEWVRSLQGVDAEFTRRRMERLRMLPGNPYDIEIREFGESVALVARRLPMVSYFNKVVGLGPTDVPRFEEIRRFYEDVPFQVEIVPDDLEPAAAETLWRFGYAQTAFHAILFALPGRQEPDPHEARSIVVVDSEETMQRYVNVNLDGWQVHPRWREQVGRVMRASYDHPEFRHYVALTPEGTPASVATMCVVDGAAYYGNAATIPERRGQGYQQFLLRRIIHDARAIQCRWVVGMAGFGSTSHRNMARAGMRLASAFGIWKPVQKR